jgi:two-component system, OmpR family, sensor histidine kinase KdpD
MRPFRTQFLAILLRHLAAAAAVLLATFTIRPFQSSLALQIIVLLYLLPVMLSTVLWGLTPGILASLMAFLLFNYFFIEPYHTFQVHTTQDLITLIIFLIVAVVMSQLIGQAREGTRMARSREWEATRMYELLSGLAGLQDSKSIAEILAVHTYQTFACFLVEVDVKRNKNQTALVVTHPDKEASPNPPTRIPLMTARGAEGELRIWREPKEFSTEELRLVEAFTSQGALALERIRLTLGVNKARVLEESDQLKTSLLNSVSHELRSPLAAIKASVSSLRSGTVNWESSARQDLLETVEEETDHLNLLVGNLLDMSRIESGALKPNLRWNSIGEIVRGVAAKMRKQLQDHSLVIQLDETLPLVPTDYVMMEQVFTNLLSNSIKYAPPNTTIQVTGLTAENYLHIMLTNEGPLVPAEHIERIFDKFNRVTEADKITGTGLGLSICKGIIEAHHGKIWAENQTCCLAFHLLLPCTINGSLPELPKEANNG